jgi:UPF0716 protein FxsA
MWLFVLFVAVPMIEIGLFIQVGGLIGLWPTLGLVLISAILGSWLVRSQGARELANLQASFSQLRDPTEPLANGAMILIAGVLLLTPGFFTDALGILLLVPPIRRAVFKFVKSRVTVATFSAEPDRGGPKGRADVIEGEFFEVDPAKRPTHQPSGWTKH